MAIYCIVILDKLTSIHLHNTMSSLAFMVCRYICPLLQIFLLWVCPNSRYILTHAYSLLCMYKKDYAPLLSLPCIYTLRCINLKALHNTVNKWSSLSSQLRGLFSYPVIL